MKSTIYAYSHIGNSRANQEDNFFIGKGKYLSPSDRDAMSGKRRCYVDTHYVNEGACCFVSDGMGGHSSGEVASLFVAQYIDANFERLISGCQEDKEYIKYFVKELNDEFCQVAKREMDNCDMGATLCGIVSFNRKVLCINAGDSRVYAVKNGNIQQITVDNTEGQRLVGLGLLTEEEVKDFPKRKAIYKYIGKEVELIPDIYEINDIENGTCLLLCSDGLTDALSNEEILEIMNKQYISTLDKGKFLVEIAVEKNKDVGDNITLIIIEY